MVIRIRTVRWILFWAGFLLLGVGFAVNGMWNSIAGWPSACLACLTLASLLASFAFARLLKSTMATASLLIWLIAAICFAGIASSLAVVLIAAVAIGVGSLFVPAAEGGAGRELSVLVGLSLVCGTVGWLLPFPIHYRAAYIILLLAVAAMRRRAIVATVRTIPATWTAAIAESPRSALLAVTTLGAVSTCGWLPTIHFDDLSYHLALPAQLVDLGYYQMSAGSSLWAVSAWAADVLQGITWLVAGRESRSAVDLSWFVLAAVLLWKLGESLELKPWVRWLAVAAYASLPMTAGALTGMQTEGPTAVVAIGVALLIQRSKIPDRRQLIVAVLLLGFLLAMKVSNLMLIGPLGLWLLLRWRERLPWRALPISMLLGIFVAGSSYVYGYALTGNPVLPIFNGIFKSSYYLPINFYDGHWISGFHWNILWDMVFHTSRYVEGGDGAAGFVLIALSGSLVLAVLNRCVRPLALVGMAALLLPLTQVQYLRYVHPAMALLVPVMFAGAPLEVAGSHLRAVVVALLVLVAGNLAFVSTADWQLRDGVLSQFLTQSRPAFLERYAPMRLIAEVVRDRYGKQARVLITSSAIPFAAEFAGRAFVVGWYDQELSTFATQANQETDGAAWSNVIDRTGANLVVLQAGAVSTGLAAAVEQQHATRVFEANGIELWELHSDVKGVSLPAPSKAVIVKFDASEAPRSPTLANATLELRCKPGDASIAVGWTMNTKGGAPESKYEWVRCRWDGLANTSFAMTSTEQVTNLMVTASPVQALDMGLELSSANASFRRDLTAERDLATRWRQYYPFGWAKDVNARRLARRRRRLHNTEGSGSR